MWNPALRAVQLLAQSHTEHGRTDTGVYVPPEHVFLTVFRSGGQNGMLPEHPLQTAPDHSVTELTGGEGMVTFH